MACWPHNFLNVEDTIKFFSQFEFPATTSLCIHKNPRIILTRSSQISPPWSTKKCDLEKRGPKKVVVFCVWRETNCNFWNFFPLMRRKIRKPLPPFYFCILFLHPFFRNKSDKCIWDSIKVSFGIFIKVTFKIW